MADYRVINLMVKMSKQLLMYIKEVKEELLYLFLVLIVRTGKLR